MKGGFESESLALELMAIDEHVPPVFSQESGVGGARRAVWRDASALRGESVVAEAEITTPASAQ